MLIVIWCGIIDPIFFFLMNDKVAAAIVNSKRLRAILTDWFFAVREAEDMVTIWIQ